ncbi:uncharacterized protein LOC135708466 [Ochlerotatus camptorhynchus]|uniref:uncharacterized protein LOC135708466 n=1 Tax=Ochlerotatus camptorhynchus TaxID=644619 RepID=UPI0031DB27FC
MCEQKIPVQIEYYFLPVLNIRSGTMSNRRSRFSLSLVRRSESPKSPIGELNISTDSGCSTPRNTRKRGNSFKSDSPVPYECDHSPIPMSQDASNLVSGVSWAWNSPKRAIANDHRLRQKPLSSSNQISYKDPESSRSYRKIGSDKLTGFYRFQSELKLLQERDEPTSDPFEVQKTLSCSSMQVVPPTSPPPSPDGDNLFLIKNPNNKTSAKKQRRESLIVKPRVSSEVSDSFNNSDFDNLLLQASQAVERDESTSDTFEVKKTLSCSSMQVIPPTSPPPSPDGGKLQHKNVNKKTSARVHSFNNSDLDNLLMQASQAVEHQFDATVILPKRPNLTTLTAEEQQPEKSRNFFKSRTTENFDSNSDDSFPESELELLLQHVVLPGTTKINSETTLDNKDSKKPSVGYLSKSSLLTRHKSMPESPSHKITNSRTRNTKTGVQSPLSISSSSNGSVMFVPNENDVVVIASSSGSLSLASSSTTDPARKCSKEEIEQKRQEALKRQASRLKRLMQGNHSQSDATIFKL